MGFMQSLVGLFLMFADAEDVHNVEATPAEPEAKEEAKEEQKESEPESKEDVDYQSKVASLEEKLKEAYDKLNTTQSSTQKRIDELTAHLKRIQESQKTNDTERDLSVQIERQEQKLTAEITANKNRILDLDEALEECSSASERRKIKEQQEELREKNIKNFNALEDIDYAKREFQERKKSSSRVDTEAAVRQFGEFNARIARDYSELFVKENGEMTINEENPVVKRAVELFNENGRESRIGLINKRTGDPMLVNPEYDYPRGFYDAVSHAFAEYYGKQGAETKRKIQLEKKRADKAKDKTLDPGNGSVNSTLSSLSQIQREMDKAKADGDVARFNDLRFKKQAMMLERK